MGPKILHRPGLIRPSGSQGQSRIFGPIGSISRSIADTLLRYAEPEVVFRTGSFLLSYNRK